MYVPVKIISRTTNGVCTATTLENTVRECSV